MGPEDLCCGRKVPRAVELVKEFRGIGLPLDGIGPETDDRGKGSSAFE
jgi:hypothetical protein